MQTDPKQVPPESTVPDGAQLQSMQEVERRHFVFAMVLVLGCVLALPVMGALYVLMISWGWIASPYTQ